MLSDQAGFRKPRRQFSVSGHYLSLVLSVVPKVLHPEVGGNQEESPNSLAFSSELEIGEVAKSKKNITRVLVLGNVELWQIRRSEKNWHERSRFITESVNKRVKVRFENLGNQRWRRTLVNHEKGKNS